MPTFLEVLVDEVAAGHTAGFDEKARQSLLHGVEAVHGLSILQRLGSVREEVRNPSAFVEKSCRTAKANGGPGALEIDNALQRLSQSGILDENVCDMLRKGSVQDAAGALAALMGQERSSVRNTSAYVTRNMMNAKKGVGGCGGCGGGGGGSGGCGGYGGQMVIGASGGGGHHDAPPPPPRHSGGGGGGAVGMSVMDLFARWQTALDPKAVDALNQVGTCAAGEVLMELERIGGTVRNPSAYVSKACENRLREVGMMPAMPFQVAESHGSSQPAYAPQAPPLPPPGGGSDLASLLAKYRSAIDEEALGALQKISPENAAYILDNLKPSVRKPSAYVVRSVGNLLKDGQGGAPNPAVFNAAAAGGSYGGCAGGGYGGGGRSGDGSFGGWGDSGYPASLDEKARQTLKDLPPAMAESILTELQTKGAEIKNPSAYVSRAAGNARRGEGHAASAGLAGGRPPLSAPAGIIGSRGIKREAPPPPPPQSGKLSEQLDQRALDALEQLPAELAGSIMHALDEQTGRIQNASAWVIKAVGNARKSQSSRDPEEGRVGGSSGDPAVMEFLLAPWRGSLDEKALQMLEEAGFQAAEHIVNELQAKRDQIRNPSAYVSKAVANFRSGHTPPGGAGASSAAGGVREDDTDVRIQLGDEIAQLENVSLDDKARQSLEDVGPHAALSIIRSLAQQGNKVNNPNAYVMRSCANERNAPKRPRMS